MKLDKIITIWTEQNTLWSKSKKQKVLINPNDLILKENQDRQVKRMIIPPQLTPLIY